MKKSVILSIVLLFSFLCVFADDSKFADALRTCSSYSESGTVETDGMKVNSAKQITGWEGNKCVYRETVSFSGINTCVTCKFTKNQINELVNVMQAYEIVQKYSNSNVDTSSVEAVQNNPVVKVWNKYLQDKNVCNMSMIK